MNNRTQYFLRWRSQNTTEQDSNFSYYHEYCRLYLANVVLTSQMK